MLSLEIDLGAVAENYRRARALAQGGEVAAVVKADAYGLGMAELAPCLAKAGCRIFFTALWQEGMALRAILPDAEIYILNGLEGGDGSALAAAGLRPCLSSPAECDLWLQLCRRAAADFPAALHVETGMNRLGLTRTDLVQLLRHNPDFGTFRPALIMSHLACAGEPEHPLNRKQLEDFLKIRQLLEAASGPLKASLANSAGMILGRDWHFDLLRPGIALLGGLAHPGFKPVVKAASHILAVKQVAAGQGAGYGADWRAEKHSRLAVIPAGYADGLPYTLWPPGDASAFIAIGGKKAPVAGRISMDMIIADITHLAPETALPGAKVEILGEMISLETLARAAGSIPHAILTGLGKRAQKLYIPATGTKKGAL